MLPPEPVPEGTPLTLPGPVPPLLEPTPLLVPGAVPVPAAQVVPVALPGVAVLPVLLPAVFPGVAPVAVVPVTPPVVVPGVPVLPVGVPVVEVLPVAVVPVLPGMPEVLVLVLAGVPMVLLGMLLGILPGMLVLPMLLLLLGVVAVAVEVGVLGMFPVLVVGVLLVLLVTLPGMLEVLVLALPTLPLLGMPLGMLPGTVVLPMLLLLLGVVAVVGVAEVLGVAGLPMVTTEGVAGLALPKPWAWASCGAPSASTEAASSGAARVRREERKAGVVDMGGSLERMAVALKGATLSSMVKPACLQRGRDTGAGPVGRGRSRPCPRRQAASAGNGHGACPGVHACGAVAP